MFRLFGGASESTTEIIETTTELIEVISKSEHYLRGIYGILAFFLLCFAMYLVYKLFNIFF